MRYDSACCGFEGVRSRFSNTCYMFIIGVLQATILSPSELVDSRRIFVAQERHHLLQAKRDCEEF